MTYNGAPNENANLLVRSPFFGFSGNPNSMRSGPIGDSQRTPQPTE